MKWFTATRSTGDVNEPGEFAVEDAEGLTWQVTVIGSKVTPGKLACARPVVCMTRDLKPGHELQGDIIDAVEEVLEEEGT